MPSLSCYRLNAASSTYAPQRRRTSGPRGSEMIAVAIGITFVAVAALRWSISYRCKNKLQRRHRMARKRIGTVNILTIKRTMSTVVYTVRFAIELRLDLAGCALSHMTSLREFAAFWRRGTPDGSGGKLHERAQTYLDAMIVKSPMRFNRTGSSLCSPSSISGPVCQRRACSERFWSACSVHSR